MRDRLRRLARLYGAHPLHLLMLLACFAIAGYAVLQLSHQSTFIRIVIWFLAAVIGHDLLLFPLYALADRSVHGALRVLRPGRSRTPKLSPLNYIRIPLLGTALLFLVFLPGIIRQGAPTYQAATGLTQAPFRGRFLLLAGAMFAVSALSYAVRLRRLTAGSPDARVRRRSGRAGSGTPAADSGRAGRD
jgi:hypothetical protein